MVSSPAAFAVVSLLALLATTFVAFTIVAAAKPQKTAVTVGKRISSATNVVARRTERDPRGDGTGTGARNDRRRNDRAS